MRASERASDVARLARSILTSKALPSLRNDAMDGSGTDGRKGEGKGASTINYIRFMPFPAKHVSDRPRPPPRQRNAIFDVWRGSMGMGIGEGERRNQKVQNPKLILMGWGASEVSVRLQKRKGSLSLLGPKRWCIGATNRARTIGRPCTRKVRRAWLNGND